MTKAIGIDFGTTDCCTYVVEDRELVLLPGGSGAPTTPSVVAFGRSGEVLVGEAARRQAPYNPEGTVASAKRLLGRKYHSPAITWLRETCPCAMVPARNGDVWVRAGDIDYSPPEIVAFLLEHLKRRAEEQLDDDVSEAVLTVPAYFGERQRQALLDAARLAGLEVPCLLNATTAAAITYGYLRREPQRIAVFSLGGGCFDISIVECGRGVFEVLAHSGDALLGGDDFDRCLVEHLIDTFHVAEEISLTDSPSAVYRLAEAARTAKHELSFASRATAIELPGIARRGTEPLLLRHPGPTRELLESLVADELERLADPCAWALEDIGLGTDDMDEVLLVGGMTRMPAVQRRVEFLFRKRPRRPPAAGELAARGAALLAAARRGDLPGLTLRDVTAHSVGIKVRGGRFSAVINRNSPVPSEQRKIFAPAKPDQGSVVLEVYQGESELVRDNAYLGRFVLDDLEPGAPIIAEFSMDERGVLGVATVNAQSGQKTPVAMVPSGGLSQTQVARISDQRTRSPDSIAPPSERVVHAEDIAADHATTLTQREGKRSLRPPPPPARRPRTEPSAEEANGAIHVETDSLVGTTLSDRYLIEEIIADGGMGRVYRARHKFLSKVFAIKVLHAELAADADLADRFVQEAQAASAIRSEHVVDISDFGHLDDGTAYFVMEHLDGKTLADVIDDHGMLPASVIVHVGLQLAEGLAAAHDMDIVHRDLKPENVTLIKRGNTDYFCKILDFGIAKRPTSDTRRRLTLAGELLGTPYYMAPEQIDGGDVDARCDLYALGAVMYEMATGEPPFDADSLVGVLIKHKEARPEPIERGDADPVPPELEVIINKCLAKEPEWRYQSARELVETLSTL